MWCGTANVPLREIDQSSEGAEIITMTSIKDGKTLTRVFAPGTVLPQSALLKQDSVVRLTVDKLSRESLARVMGRLHQRKVSVTETLTEATVSGEFEGTLSEIAAHFALDVEPR